MDQVVLGSLGQPGPERLPNIGLGSRVGQYSVYPNFVGLYEAIQACSACQRYRAGRRMRQYHINIHISVYVQL